MTFRVTLCDFDLIAESRTFVGKGRGNGKFVFMDGSNGKFVDVNWSHWQVITFGLKSSLISCPSQSEFLAFRGHPIRGSLVGVAEDFLFGFISVIVHFGDDELFLFLRLLAGRVVRLGVAVILI